MSQLLAAVQPVGGMTHEMHAHMRTCTPDVCRYQQAAAAEVLAGDSRCTPGRAHGLVVAHPSCWSICCETAWHDSQHSPSLGSWHKRTLIWQSTRVALVLQAAFSIPSACKQYSHTSTSLSRTSCIIAQGSVPYLPSLCVVQLLIFNWPCPVTLLCTLSQYCHLPPSWAYMWLLCST